MMIGYRWSTRTEGPCPSCHQPVVVKKKYLTLAGLPIPLGGPKRSCGCAQAGGPQQQQPQQQQPMPPQQMPPQQMPPQQMQPQQMQPQQPMPPQMQPQQPMPMQPQAMQQPAYPCPTCRATLQWAAQYQRWFCTACQQYR